MKKIIFICSVMVVISYACAEKEYQTIDMDNHVFKKNTAFLSSENLTSVSIRYHFSW